MIGHHQSRMRRRLVPTPAVALALALVTWWVPSPVTMASPERFLDAFTTEDWTVAGGLPQSNVRNVVAGPDGYLWVTTPRNLCRFDGTRFEEVPTPPGFDPASSPLVAASFAPDGALWLHGYRKIWRFLDGHWESLADAFFKEHPNDYEDVVRLLHRPDGSTWWLLRGGVARWQAGRALQEWMEPSMPPAVKWFSDMIIDSLGTVWLARWNGLARVLGDGVVPVPLEGILDDRAFGLRFAPRQAGGIWLYAPTGLFVLDGANIQRVAPFPNAPRVERILETADGAVWVAGDAGVHRWQDGRWSFLQPGQVPSVTRFTTLEQSASGALWLGGDGGLVCLRPRGYRRIEVPGTDSFEARSPAAAWSNGRDELLIGIHDRISRLNASGGHVDLLDTVPGANQPGTSVISALARDEHGTLWVGTGNEQLWFLTDGSWTHTTTDATSPVPATGITSILPWPNQPPFIGSVNGLMGITSRDTLRPAHPGLPLDRVQCLVRDATGTGIWIGYESSGLVHFDPSPDQANPINLLGDLPAGRVNAVLPCADGTLWISVGNSLIRWQGGKTLFEFTRQHDLPAGEAGHLADDGEGGLWLANDGKLSCIRLDDLESVAAGRRRTLRVRNHGYGLPADTVFNEVAGAPWHLPGACFAVAGGIIEARTAFLPLAVPRPDLRINTIASRNVVLANLNPVFPGAQATTPVHVPPGVNPIDIDFTAVDAGAPDLQEFRFRIRGLDNAWSNLGISHSLSLPFLPPGLHRIELAMRNADGEWIEEKTAATLLVEAWFWQTRWFFSLSFLAVALMVFALTRWLVHRRYRRRRQQEELLHQERSRIARDIHDDLGAGLTHLAMVARIAERDATQAPPGVLAGHLREVFTEASSMVRSVDEIVWAVTPANDILTALVDYVVQYAQHYLRAADLTCRVELPAFIPPLPVRSAVRHHIYMAVQEALNNIVKHARASQVHLSAAIDGKHLRIGIADDGCGFEPALVHPEDEPGGLQNFFSRMQHVGGRFDLDTSPGHGTRVTFVIPLDISVPAPALT